MKNAWVFSSSFLVTCSDELTEIILHSLLPACSVYEQTVRVYQVGVTGDGGGCTDNNVSHAYLHGGEWVTRHAVITPL